jgi:repressor LexA
MAEALTGKRLEILEFIGDSLREQGYPPSVREIGEAVGLTSSSTVHAHLAVLQREGYLRRDPTKPRAMEVRFDPSSRAAMAASPVRHVPLLGDVAAGTGVLASENVEELLPLPEDFTGSGSVFMLRVRGESMIDAGINGDVVVAGIPGEEGTVKTFARRRGKVVLSPANASFSPMEFAPEDVTIYGRVVSLLRRL